MGQSGSRLKARKCLNRRYLIRNPPGILYAPLMSKRYTFFSKERKMAKAPSIRVEDIELDGDVRLWDVMHAALAAKESQPRASSASRLC
jgi:hypothetical protein